MWRIWIKLTNITRSQIFAGVKFFIAIPTSATNESFVCERCCQIVQQNDQAEKQPEKIWTEKGSEIKGEIKNICKKRRFIYIQPKMKPSPHLLRQLFERSKESFTNTWRKIGLGLKLRSYPSL